MESHLCEPITDLGISVGGDCESCVNTFKYCGVSWGCVGMFFQLIAKYGFLFDVAKPLSQLAAP
jgi:hypothetical protein